MTSLLHTLSFFWVWRLYFHFMSGAEPRCMRGRSVGRSFAQTGVPAECTCTCVCVCVCVCALYVCVCACVRVSVRARVCVVYLAHVLHLRGTAASLRVLDTPQEARAEHCAADLAKLAGSDADAQELGSIRGQHGAGQG